MTAPRMLIVEDEGIVARDIHHQLTRLGYAVCGEADSGERAVELAGQLRPDLVLMDIRLRGDMDGVTAAEEIRRRHRLPIIYLTAHADDATLQRARVTEPFGYVLKPFEERDLRTVIEMALYRRDAERRLRQLEDRLCQAKKMEGIGRLAGGIAHDFNNLLTIINGYCSMLLEGLNSGHAWHGSLSEIRSAAERAGDLTRQLLAFSRKQILRPRVLDLNLTLAGLDPLLRRLLDRGIDLTMLLAPDAGAIRADPAQLEQVLVNLAANARNAMPDGGKLTITTGRATLSESSAALPEAVVPGTYAFVKVADTGRGMDEVTRQRIFEPFFTTQEVGKGAGLGLAAVYGTVRQSGGYVFVESVPGAGSTFTLWFPSHAGPAAEPEQAPAALNLPRGEETVLLVEDEESIRRLCREVLCSCGYTVLEASHGGEAVEVSTRHGGPIHLLATDLVMPILNGSELIERLLPDRPAMKVLCLSGFSEHGQLPPGFDDRSISFLRKPFTPSVLAAKVREILDAPEPAGNP